MKLLLLFFRRHAYDSPGSNDRFDESLWIPIWSDKKKIRGILRPLQVVIVNNRKDPLFRSCTPTRVQAIPLWRDKERQRERETLLQWLVKKKKKKKKKRRRRRQLIQYSFTATCVPMFHNVTVERRERGEERKSKKRQRWRRVAFKWRNAGGGGGTRGRIGGTPGWHFS